MIDSSRVACCMRRCVPQGGELTNIHTSVLASGMSRVPVSFWPPQPSIDVQCMLLSRMQEACYPGGKLLRASV
jgi:hypothetical protein